MSAITAVTSRRSFLAAAATAAVLPASAAAQLADPIFAIIERCRVASKEYGAASIATDEVAARQRNQPVTQADQDRYDAAAEELGEASDLLASTVPTTMGGLAAAVAWLLEYDEGSIPDTTGQFLETLAGSPSFGGRLGHGEG
jgi:hypothetical protein